jgi:exodeoxyribonuclease VII small subunit
MTHMTTKPFEFEKALKELEDITTWFESSDVDLDAGLVKFEHGMELAHQLKTHLATVENRVEKIKRRFSGANTAAPAPGAVSDSDDAVFNPEPGSGPEPDDSLDQGNLFKA